jgi:hypothetical protein
MAQRDVESVLSFADAKTGAQSNFAYCNDKAFLYKVIAI